MLSIPTAEEKPPGKKEIKDNPSEEDVVGKLCLFLIVSQNSSKYVNQNCLLTLRNNN